MARSVADPLTGRNESDTTPRLSLTRVLRTQINLCRTTEEEEEEFSGVHSI